MKTKPKLPKTKTKTKTLALKQLQMCIPIKRLSPREARILVAKDVLALLALDKLDGDGGAYANLEFKTPVKDGDLRAQLVNTAFAPTVCGIGALFVAHVARFDQLKIELSARWTPWGEEIRSLRFCASDVHRQLQGVFPGPMLEKIEAAYEASVEDEERGEERWAKRYGWGTRRMIAIMRNIIRNNGTFVMTDVG